MKYPDVVKLATVNADGYGDRTVTGAVDVQACFIKRAGYEHGSNSEGETSDAAVYLLPTDPNVLASKDDLESMYLMFGTDNWYRIKSANVAQRKLLNNKIDNVYCRLEKVAGLAYVSVS